MKERLIENWLTSASERSLEVPFAQLLMLRGHTIISGPAHHPYEHGKDILSFDDEGHLCAFQLKGGPGSFGLRDFEKHQVQLHALATTAVRHPNLTTSRVPDEVYLVTNQQVSPAARDRIVGLSEGLRDRGYTGIEVLELHQLLDWFVSAHGSFFPQEADDLASFLRVLLKSGAGPLPHDSFTHAISKLMPSRQRAKRTECARAVTAATLLSAYMLGPWQEKQNHLAIAEGWLLLCSEILHLAAFQELREIHWEPSYLLAMEAARDALEHLLSEAADSSDLLGGGFLGEGLVYGTKVLLVGGYLSVFALSSPLHQTGRPEDSEAITTKVAAVLYRELPFLRLIGEFAAPYYFAMAYLLSRAGDFRASPQMIVDWARVVCHRNAPGSSSALPDPYHGPEELLMTLVSTDAREELNRERWDGASYTLHLAVSWLTRRLWRGSLQSLWSEVTRITHLDFLPASTSGFLLAEDASGTLNTRQYETPTSWRAIRSEADHVGLGCLTDLLTTRPDFMLFYPLLRPHRFNSQVLGFWDTLLIDGGSRLARSGAG